MTDPRKPDLPHRLVFAGKAAQNVLPDGVKLINAVKTGFSNSKIPVSANTIPLQEASQFLDGFNQVMLPVAIVVDSIVVADSVIKDVENKCVDNTVKAGAAIAGRWAGGYGGYLAGTAIGTAVCPVLGTLIGGAVGGIAGAIGGGKAAYATADAMFNDINAGSKKSTEEWKVRERANAWSKARMRLLDDEDDTLRPNPDIRERTRRVDPLDDEDDTLRPNPDIRGRTRRVDRTNPLTHKHVDDDFSLYHEIENEETFSEKHPSMDTGIAGDRYFTVEAATLSPSDRNSIRQQYATQPSEGTINCQKFYSNIYNTQDSWYLKVFDGNPNPGRCPKGRSVDEYSVVCGWLHLRTPPNFAYTLGILTNHSYQGLLHAFIRHWDQFQRHIPELRKLISKLPIAVQDMLKKVAIQGDPISSARAIGEFDKLILGYDSEDIQTFLRAQILILKYVQQSLGQYRYLGEGVNNNGMVQVYFSVTDNQGNDEIMVVAVSNELYEPVAEFDDKRAVRTVNTIYFMSKYEFAKFRKGVYKCFP
uniref:Gly-zipper_Omp domain-containing protein n=1 Tax=Panagrellus redivivus TaxID=6233 RepID=A0A7E4ZYE4_PANRE